MWRFAVLGGLALAFIVILFVSIEPFMCMVFGHVWSSANRCILCNARRDK